MSMEPLNTRRDAFDFLRDWHRLVAKAPPAVGENLAEWSVPAVFPAHGNDVEILESPTQFYETLCDEIARCEVRVSLAALYIGHGELERRLLTTIRDKLQERVALARVDPPSATTATDEPFQLNLLVDYARALRGLPPAPAAATQAVADDVAAGGGVPSEQADVAAAAPPAAQVVERLGQASLLWQHVFGGGLADDVAGGLELSSPGAANTVAAQIALFRHPKFDEAGWLNRIPGSLRETVAVQHVKAYVIDDTVIMSGANLSHDYFTNRQDRYVVFRNVPELASYYTGLIGGVLAKHSHRLHPHTAEICPPEISVANLGGALGSWQREWAQQHPAAAALGNDTTAPARAAGRGDAPPGAERAADTWVAPSVQLQHLGVDDDHRWTLAFLDAVRQHVRLPRLSIATGYFNCPDDYSARLMAIGLPTAPQRPQQQRQQQQTKNGSGGGAGREAGGSGGSFEMLTAAPRANGFFGGRGFLGAVPMAYNQYLKRFLRQLRASGAAGEICEYERPHWTYHAKGIWVEGTGAGVGGSVSAGGSGGGGGDGDGGGDPAAGRPTFLTIVGSSNFGFRSVERDLESQLFVGTTNPGLQARLAAERDGLLRHCARQVDEARVLHHPDRRLRHGPSRSAGSWIRPASWLLRRFF